MKISDIIVGKKYRYVYDSNKTYVMLGIGMRKIGTDNEYTEKHLVIVDSIDKEAIGKMIQEGENASDSLWDTIVEEDCGLFVLSI